MTPPKTLRPFRNHGSRPCFIITPRTRRASAAPGPLSLTESTTAVATPQHTGGISAPATPAAHPPLELPQHAGGVRRRGNRRAVHLLGHLHQARDALVGRRMGGEELRESRGGERVGDHHGGDGLGAGGLAHRRGLRAVGNLVERGGEGFGVAGQQVDGVQTPRVLNFGADKEFTDRVSLADLNERYGLTVTHLAKVIRAALV